MEKERRLERGTLGSVELRAQLLEANRQGERAIELLREFATKNKKDPMRLFLVIASLQRQKRFSEALDCCEEAWKSCQPEDAGGASLATLKAGKTGPEHFRRVEAWLREGLKQKPDSSVLLLQLADLEEMQGRNAEAVYRDVLKRDKDNLVALNNLAWQLAQLPGRGADALPLINRAIELTGARPELLDTRAVVHLNMSKGDLALADLERVARDDPSATRHFRLARAYQMTNNIPSALSSLEMAMNAGLDPQRLHPTERATFQKLRAELQRP
jgi:tetratricopeptide (TPR) repeat protein